METQTRLKRLMLTMEAASSTAATIPQVDNDETLDRLVWALECDTNDVLGRLEKALTAAREGLSDVL